MPSPAIEVQVDWDEVVVTSRTTLTTHLWAAPPLRRGAKPSAPAFAALRALRADRARFLSFWTHPVLAVPALTPPTAEGTSWDFAHLDPMLEDFMAASEGRDIVANLATIPTWMFDTPEPVVVDDDPDAAVWHYEQGTRARDASLVEIADYFERIARWYVDGGFTDEHGRHHTSGHAYRFAWWEVLCEPDVGHEWTPEDYVRLYDLVVARLRPLDPDMRFVGLSLSPITRDADYWWTFLDPANHADGIPLDAVSHHFYATPRIADPFDAAANPPFATWPETFFAQAEGFLDKVALIESIKQRLSPHTETHINEIGTFTPAVMAAEPDVPAEYWTLGGALVAYLWSRLCAMGIEVVGVAEFLGYPTVIPGTSLVDWETGEPNARYRVLALLLDHFGPGDRVVATGRDGLLTEPALHAQGFVTAAGEHLVLLVNREPGPVDADLTTVGRPVRCATVDTASADGPPRVTTPASPVVTLGAFATAVVTVERRAGH